LAESAIVTGILRTLALKGVWAWRANSGTQVLKATAKAQRRVIRGAPAGTPDILLVLPVRKTAVCLGDDGMTIEERAYGALCGLEVKTATGRQLPSQKAWQARAEAAGVRYAVVRSIKEALAAVEGWSRV
jgi:hypothetical protein